MDMSEVGTKTTPSIDWNSTREYVYSTYFGK